jgi:lysophospholipase L1-like esterase
LVKPIVIVRKTIPTVVFGDSVVLGARNGIKEALGKVAIDAEVGRQPKVIAERIRARRDQGRLGNTVVIHMGTNGTIRAEDLRSILDELSDRTRVVLVNDRVPRVWMKPNNKTIDSLIPDYPNVRLADWEATSKGHKGWFASDGVHLTKTGAIAFGSMISEALNAP